MSIGDLFQIVNDREASMHVFYRPVTGSEKTLVLWSHGFASACWTAHNQAFVRAINDNHHPVLQVDATNSHINDSAGELHEYTIGCHTQDIRDSLSWVQRAKPGWLSKSFAIAGHSVAGMSALQIAAENPDQTKFVIAASPMISGKKLKAAWSKDHLAQWQAAGSFKQDPEPPYNEPGQVPWSIWENDWLKQDLYPLADRLTMPILFLVGFNDAVCPANDTIEFAKSLPNQHPNNRIVVIEGADHRLKDEDGHIKKDEISEAVGLFLNDLS